MLAMTGWLIGCAVTPPLVPSEPRSVPVARSIVFTPPGTVGIISVVETRYNNAIEQLVVLETRSRSPGQNSIRIQAFAGDAPSRTNGGLRDVPLVNLDMAGEARGTISFADMRLSPYFVQNYYGPFGYSMGRTATGDTCMYAWQRIPPERQNLTGLVTRGAINLRMQLCDRSWTERQLLAVMLDLTIRGVDGLPVVVPLRPGQVGQPIAPSGVLGVGNVLEAPTPAPALPPRPVAPPEPAPEPATTPDSPIPAPDPKVSPEIPSPPGTDVPDSPVQPSPIIPMPNFYAPLEGRGDGVPPGYI